LFVRIQAPILFQVQRIEFYTVSITMLDLARRKGITAITAFAFAVLAMCLWPRIQHALAYAIGRIAHLLLAHMGEAGRSTIPRVKAPAIGAVFIWRLPLRECARQLEEGMDEAMTIGDQEWMSYQALYFGEVLVASQVPLPIVLTKLCAMSKMLASKGFLMPCQYQLTFLSQAEQLADTELTQLLTNLPAEASASPFMQFGRLLVKTRVAFIMRRAQEALEHSTTALQFLPGVAGLAGNADFTFYRVLALVETCCRYTHHLSRPLLTVDDVPSAALGLVLPAGYDAAKVDAVIVEIDALIAKMKVWAQRAPANYLAKFHLMHAERCRLLIFSHRQEHALVLPASQYYDAAADGAQRNEMLLDKALSLELASRFYVEIHRMSSARAALLRSHAIYTSYGAHLKLKQLRNEFPGVLFPVTAEPSGRTTSNNGNGKQLTPAALKLRTLAGAAGTTGSPSTPVGGAAVGSTSGSHSSFPAAPSLDGAEVVARGGTPMQTAFSDHEVDAPPAEGGSVQLDALSVLKSTASFSTEKDKSKLLKRLMRIVLETAGATRGVLVLEDANREGWSIELGGSVDADDAEATKQQSEAHRTEVPTTASASAGTSAAPPSVPPSSHSSAVPLPAPMSVSGSSHSSSSSSSATSASTNSSRTRMKLGRSMVGNGMQTVENALPVSVFTYVQATVETLCIADPHQSADPAYASFSKDPYFVLHKPKALLCMPVLRGGSVCGALYLENDHRCDAFTSSHIQLLQLLCGQAALSIDNARLYAALSENNASLQLRSSELEENNRLLSVAKEAAEAASKMKADFLSNSTQHTRTHLQAAGLRAVSAHPCVCFSSSCPVLFVSVA
jgi:GAF domain-containing protein